MRNPPPLSGRSRVLSVSRIGRGGYGTGSLRTGEPDDAGFFLAFAVSFAIEAAYRIAVLLLPKPNEDSPWLYLLRLLGYLVILLAIVRKNYGRGY